MEPVLQAIYDSILNGQQKVTSVKVQEALEQGIGAGAVLNDRHGDGHGRSRPPV